MDGYESYSDYDSLESAGEFDSAGSEEFSDYSDDASFGSMNKKPDAAPSVKSGASIKKNGKTKSATKKKRPDLTVRALNPYEHDALNTRQTIYHVFLEGSLNELSARAKEDDEGNEMPLKIFLGENMHIGAAPEDVLSRIEANKLRSDATVDSLRADPSKISDFRDIVTSVYVSGHSEIPRLELVLDNLKGSADRLRASEAKGGYTQSCVIRCEGGNKLENKRVLLNEFDDDDISYFERMSRAGAKEIDLTPKIERPDKNGVEWVSVEFDPSLGHDVIRMIQRDYKNHPDCTENERKLIQRKKIVPESVLKKDKNHDGVILIRTNIYNHYRAICEEKRKRRRPYSDVAHPFGVATRMVHDVRNHFTDTSKNAMHVEAKKIWTNPVGINIGASSDKSNEQGFKKKRGAYFEITVNHIAVKDLPNLLAQ